MNTPAFRRRPDGVVTLCDPRTVGTVLPLVVCRGMQPTAQERARAQAELAQRRSQVPMFGGE